MQPAEPSEVRADHTASVALRPWAGERLKLTVTMLGIAFAVKAVLLFAVLPVVSNAISPGYSIGFADLYDVIGLNIAQGIGYRVEPETTVTMIREPGYPLFLAGVFKIAGYSIEAVRGVNLLLSVGIAFMMVRLGRRITGDTTVALVATLLFLFYPSTLLSEARGGIEVVFIFAVMLFMLAIHRAAETGERWRYLVAGALLGAVVLFRGTPMLFPGFLLVYFFLTGRTVPERLRAILNIAVLGLGMAVVITPWVARNYLLAGRIVPTATVQGIAAQEGQFTCQRLEVGREFWQLQDEAAAERYEVAGQLGRPFKGPYYQIFYSPQDEMAFNERLLAGVGARYRSDPLLLARCAAKNLFFNFWFLGKTWQATAWNVVVQAPLLLLALGGVYVLWKRGHQRRIALIVGFIAYIVAVHILIISHARHSVPLIPFLSILASVSLVTMWRSLKRRPIAAT